jgi:glycosidase
MALKRIKPDLLLLAEAPAYDPYYFSRGFDAAYDWHNIGGWAWQPVFENSGLFPLYLREALTYGGQGIPKGGLVFRFLNNNDTGARFPYKYGFDNTRVAAAMEFTLPGLPLVYGGDEIGANYDPYFDLEPLQWNQDPHHLRPYYRKLIRIRARWAALRSRRWSLLDASPGDRVLAYVRERTGSRSVLVVLNFGEKATALVPRTASLGSLRRAIALRDVLNDQRVETSGKELRVSMPPFSARILVGP